VHAKSYYKRTKYVNIYYNYIKDRVKVEYISLEYIYTYNIAADELTKPLNRLSY
jgi:hypothetical protein